MAKHHRRTCPCPPDPVTRAHSIFRSASTCDEKRAAAEYIARTLEVKAAAIPETPMKGGKETKREHFERLVIEPQVSRLRASVARSCGAIPNERFARARAGLFGLGFMGL